VYRIVVPCIVFLLLAGCKGSSTSSGTPKGTDTPSPGNTTSSKPGTSTASNDGQEDKEYYGRSLKAWFMMLTDDDKAISENAAAEIQKIAAPALPILVKAMDSKKDYVKINTLEILAKGKDWAKGEEKTLAPVLKKALHDDSAAVRQEASKAIAALQFPECVEALRQASKKEEDPKTKTAMEKDLATIK
jgi:HEAT repeat protein